MALRGERVIAVISPRSSIGLKTVGPRTPGILPKAHSEAGLMDNARFIANVLVAEGFELLNFHSIAISFSGLVTDFERVFGLRPIVRTFASGRGHQVAGFDVRPEDAHRLETLPEVFEGRAGEFALARPPRLIDDAGMPLRDVAANDCAVWSLPDEIAMATWADGVGAPVVTGHNVVVAQIGTGHYRHRFFSDRGYRVLPALLGPGQQEPLRDDHGQSTGEAACLFGAAPDLRLRPIKGLLDPVGDLLIAIDSTPSPNLIVNSWGYEADQSGWTDLERTDPNLFHYLKILDAAISFAAARGVMMAALAPKTWRSFPACHPDVIAIAPVPRGRGVQPANRSISGGNLYPEKQAPDLAWDAAKSVRSGLDLIGCTHPVQANSVLAAPLPLDVGGDEGFAWCDIDLAAAPLAASRLALLLEQHPGLSPKDVRSLIAEDTDTPDVGKVETATGGEGLHQLTGERSA
jgi:hypothetical protein